VADDGIGMSNQSSDRFGLSIMAERAERIGAELAIFDRDGGGTVVEVSVSNPTPSLEPNLLEPQGRGTS
jgi:hypothetical protein